MEIALRAQRAGQSLSRWLAPLAFTDWSAARVTSELTRAIVAWGVNHRWRVRCEVPSLAGLPGAHPDRPGYLDVVCERLDGPPIAIEIDQQDKPWSLRKLLAEAGAGVVPVWVRWGEPGTRPVPAPVALVEIVTPYRLAGPTGRRLYSKMAVALQPPPAPENAVAAVQEVAPAARCRATTKEGQPCSIDARPQGCVMFTTPRCSAAARRERGRSASCPRAAADVNTISTSPRMPLPPSLCGFPISTCHSGASGPLEVRSASRAR
ncbi:hypothetical protein [Nonomuraea polychroma]|uniref:hypothetical protein n=1 Tax=Nonomuraea polychroma TaxID=46176 RepID=UPI000FDCEC27|nr:hypothetical protein [Nonomuraea polychroma]